MNDTHAQTLISAACIVKGELHLTGEARIAGRVEGRIEAADTLIIEAGATIEADITAEVIDIHGTVKGNIIATRACRLGASARVSGEIRAANLAISEGACFIGQVYVGGAQPAEETPTVEDNTDALIDEAALRLRDRMTQLHEAPAPVETVPAAAASPNVRVMPQAVQQTLQTRAPRVIKVH